MDWPLLCLALFLACLALAWLLGTEKEESAYWKRRCDGYRQLYDEAVKGRDDFMAQLTEAYRKANDGEPDDC